MTRDDSLPKPHPDGVIKASAKMGVSVEELMVVGDYRFDIIAGKSAGARTVLLTNGKKPALLLEDPEPDHVVDRLEEILDLL
jgi:phosphoglycolate phosphatase-like HAD superfamily hydrolase